MRAIYFVIICLIFFSCKKSLEVIPPTYISIDSISFQTDYLKMGSSSDNIDNAWIFINNNLIGAYPLPARVPILTEGNVDLKIFGGVQQNGIVTKSIRYLFYEPFSRNIDLESGKSYKINPTVTYHNDAKLSFHEDFEGVGMKFEKTTRADTALFFQNIKPFEGSSSGGFYVKENQVLFEVESKELKGVVTLTEPIFLEMDYKSTHNILVGVKSDGAYVPAVLLNQSQNWRKVYLNLTAALLEKKNAFSLRVFFAVSAPSTIAEGALDNIKIINFK